MALKLAALAAAPLGAVALTVSQGPAGMDFVCRAELPDGSWGPCSSKATKTAAPHASSNLLQPRAAARLPPVELLPQEELNVATKGSWENVEGELPRNSLGSLSRYAACSLYLGPKSDLGKMEGKPIPQEVLQTPHSPRLVGHANRSKCHEYRFLSKANEDPSLHKYSWATQESAQQCTQGRWIAFWGDSTTRITFSAMADFLAGGIDDPSFPTHDWSFDLHAETIDKCNEAEQAKSGVNCHLAAHIPKSRTTVTYNWVTKMNMWPSLKKRLANFHNKNEFPNLQLNAIPDVLLVNSGPWEMYQLKEWTGWIGNDQYTQVFNSWMENDFAGLLKEGEGQVSTKLIMLGNTACPQGRALLCKVNGKPCTYSMWDLASLQKRILKEKGAELGLADSIRWVDSRALYDPLPQQYRCIGSGFHLPSVVTDARVNHIFHAMCSR